MRDYSQNGTGLPSLSIMEGATTPVPSYRSMIWSPLVNKCLLWNGLEWEGVMTQIGTHSIIAPGTGTAPTAAGCAITCVGTVSHPVLTSASYRAQSRRFSIMSAATLGAISSMRIANLECWRGNAAGIGGFMTIARFGLSAISSGNRAFVGLTDTASTAPTNVDPLSSTTPGRIGMAINANTGNWSIVNAITGATPTITPLGNSFPVDTTTMYELKIGCPPNGAYFYYSVINLATGAITSGTLSTNIPGNTTFLGRTAWVTNNALTTAVTIDIGSFNLESYT